MPDSSKRGLLLDLLKSRRISCYEEVREGIGGQPDFVILIRPSAIGRSASRSQTSRRQMGQLRSFARKKLGIQVDWVEVPDGLVEQIQMTLMDVLNARSPGTIRSVSISALDRDPIWVWAYLEKPTTRTEFLELLHSITEDVFRSYGQRKPTTVLANADDLPGDLWLLRLVKVNQPVWLDKLHDAVLASFAGASSQTWLSHRLDALRKQGLVHRTRSGSYALTLGGLRQLPRGKRRASSDVERIMRLSRRKW